MMAFKIVPVPDEIRERCRYLLAMVGLANPRKEFEKHFDSNEKVLTFCGDYVLMASDFSFFDWPGGLALHNKDTGMVEVVTRSFEVGNHLFARLNPYMQLDGEAVEAFMRYEPGRGPPIGMIFDNDERKKQVLGIGNVVEGEFCKLLYCGPERKEVRLYASPKNLSPIDLRKCLLP